MNFFSFVDFDTLFGISEDLFVNNFWIYTFRILLASIIGGIIGLERGYHGRAAGLRTHMLVTIGSCISALLGLYLAFGMAKFNISTDVQRTGAQVISGIGFLGAGSILLKKGSSQITGLTTAAGLWTTAAIGLAIGYGLIIPAIITAIVVVITFTLMSKLEFQMRSGKQRMFVYMEIDNLDAFGEVRDMLEKQYSAAELKLTPARSGDNRHIGIEALMVLHRDTTMDSRLKEIEQYPHIILAMLT